MLHYSAFLFLRMIRAFQAYKAFQAVDLPAGATGEIELIKEHTTATGHIGVIKFNGREYLMQIRPIMSEVEVKDKLMYSDVIKDTGLE